jgi:hypothetical protein
LVSFELPFVVNGSELVPMNQLSRVQIDAEYDSSGIDSGLVYYSVKYREFLRRILDAENFYLAAGKNESPSALMPTFVKSGPCGLVANSLPFFGSHGSPIVDLNSELKVIDMLLEFEKHVSKENWSSVTIVENPLTPIQDSDLKKLAFLKPVDIRLSQITHAKEHAPESLDDLLRRFHGKMRNAIRKGAATGQVVIPGETEDDWDFLIKEHQKSIEILGGVPKSFEVFNALREVFGKDAQLHCGFVQNKRSAALLTIRYGESIEYFVPVVNDDFRSSQALSHLIASVMLSEFQNGIKFWNWGGTWQSQIGVHQFKNRFDAKTLPYRYLHWSKPELIEFDRQTLLKTYPFFYVRKFS